jgi:hypothetical protein
MGISFFAYAQDLTPPSVRLADIVVTTTENSVEARWGTDEPASSNFEYGTTEQFGANVIASSSLRMSHNIAIFNLAADTRYFYRIKTTDAANNNSTTIALSFVTKTRSISPVEEFPRIFDIQTLARTENLLRLYFRTSKDSVSWVAYGKDSKNLDKITPKSSQYTSIHSVELMGLEQGTTYYYQIHTQAANGKTADSPTTFFQTIATPSQTVTQTKDLQGQVAELQKQITALVAKQGQTSPPSPSPVPTEGQKQTAFRYTFTKPLYYGLRLDPEVKALQKALTTLGLYSGPQTGNFFGLTVEAVKKFQQKYGISAIGRVGPGTRTKLNELFSK